MSKARQVVAAGWRTTEPGQRFYVGATLEPDARNRVAFYRGAAGSQVFITPCTLKCFNTAPTELIVGVLPSDNRTVTHAHKFEPETQLLVW